MNEQNIKTIGILGRGKTGSKVHEILEKSPQRYHIEVFHRENPLTREALSRLDGVISFFPGEAFLEVISLLVERDIPVVTGSTGMEWPQGREKFHQMLVEKNRTWIHGHNFSLGMNLVKEMLTTLSKATKLFSPEEVECHIHEVHHTKKLDAPSGTAIAWSEWLGLPAQITSEREGDVVGDHQLRFKTPYEQIDLRHQALDRKIFASGAVWAMESLLTGKIPQKPGLHVFQDVAIKILFDHNTN